MTRSVLASAALAVALPLLASASALAQELPRTLVDREGDCDGFGTMQPYYLRPVYWITAVSEGMGRAAGGSLPASHPADATGDR